MPGNFSNLHSLNWISVDIASALLLYVATLLAAGWQRRNSCQAKFDLMFCPSYDLDGYHTSFS